MSETAMPRDSKRGVAMARTDRDPPVLIWSIAPDMGETTQITRFITAYLVRML